MVTNDGFAVDLAFDQLAQSLFGGPVLLIGHADLSSLSAALTRGKDLGLAMLPVLTTPYRHRDLRERLSAVLSIEPPEPPPVDVAGALHSGWFELWYQPKVEMRSLELCGAEALIRLRHPTWGVVPPAYFIPDDGDPHFRALSEFVIERRSPTGITSSTATGRSIWRSTCRSPISRIRRASANSPGGCRATPPSAA